MTTQRPSFESDLHINEGMNINLEHTL